MVQAGGLLPKAMNLADDHIHGTRADFLLVKQTEHSGTQAGMAKISLACVGWQAVLDSYQCLMHLTGDNRGDSLPLVLHGGVFPAVHALSVFEMRVLLQSEEPKAQLGAKLARDPPGPERAVQQVLRRVPPGVRDHVLVREQPVVHRADVQLLLAPADCVERLAQRKKR